MTARVRRRLALAFATAALIAVLAWLAAIAGRGPAAPPPPGPAVATAGLDGALPPAPVAATIARARAEVRARVGPRAIIPPPSAPAPGLPSWTTYLPGQRDPGMPTPLGAR